jgi:fatty acid desaturase
MLSHRTAPTSYYITRIITVIILPVFIYVLQLFGKASLPIVIVVILLFCLKVVGDTLTLFPPPAHIAPRTPSAPRCRYCATKKSALIPHPVRHDAHVCHHCYKRYLLSPAYLNALLGKGR